MAKSRLFFYAYTENRVEEVFADKLTILCDQIGLPRSTGKKDWDGYKKGTSDVRQVKRIIQGKTWTVTLQTMLG